MRQHTLLTLKGDDALCRFLVILTSSLSIDFWTTKCTRCPDALDKLNAMASDAKYADVQFVSICCDQLDGAREIIEATDEKRWNNIQHYFMSPETKEEAKKLLGFKSVPFYVIVNKNGIMTQKGSSKQVDFNTIPGMVEKENVVQRTPIVENKVVNGVESKIPSQPAVVSPDRVLTIDLDFDF